MLIFVLDRRPHKLWPVRAVYRKIPITSPGLIFVQKAFLLGLFSGVLIFRGAYYWREFCVSKWVDLTMKTASTNCPWAYIREGLLSEGYLRLRFGGLIFGRTYFGGGGLLSEFYDTSTATCVSLTECQKYISQHLQQHHECVCRRKN